MVTSMSKVVDEIKKVNGKFDEVEGEIKKLPDTKDLNEEGKRFIRKKEEDLRKEKEDLRKKEELLLDDLRKEKTKLIPHDDLKDLKLIVEYLGPETENLDLGSHKALILFLPSSVVFRTFDGFVVYGRGDSTMSKIAFQTKTGNTYPKRIPSKLLHFMLFYLFIILLHHFKI